MVKRIVGYPVNRIYRARMPQDPTSVYDILFDGSTITGLEPSNLDSIPPENVEGVYDAQGCIVAPSLCHARIHLDRCFLLSDPKYSDLQVTNGDFQEAMDTTSKAKTRYDEENLLARGRRLITESINAGVTAMRAFVDVDETVGLTCVNAAIRLRDEFSMVCDVQICVFAQLALFSGQGGGFERRRVLTEAIRLPGVEAVGSTPFVEDNQHNVEQNVDWTITLALTYGKHLDLDLDFHLNVHAKPHINMVIDKLRGSNWEANASSDRTICFGSCTRLTLFAKREWTALKEKIGSLPIHFVATPMSDLFMMAKPVSKDDGGGVRQRATLQIPQMVNDYSLNGAIAVNHIGNAFTPQGSCDPLTLASLGVGLYHAGTRENAETLFQCVSTSAKNAIGMTSSGSAVSADLVIYGSGDELYNPASIADIVYTPTPHRTIIRQGKIVSLR